MGREGEGEEEEREQKGGEKEEKEQKERREPSFPLLPTLLPLHPSGPHSPTFGAPSFPSCLLFSFFFGATVRPILVAKFGLANAKMCHNRSCRNFLLAKVGAKMGKPSRPKVHRTAPHTHSHAQCVFALGSRAHCIFRLSYLRDSQSCAARLLDPPLTSCSEHFDQ